MSERERRSFAGIVEVREEDGKPTIEGYAAVFGQTIDIMGMFEEEIDPAAFDRALKEKQDVRCLKNHDPSLLLGRTKSGTLKLSADDHGLKYTADPPDSTAGKDSVIEIKRGDMSGSSFAFIIRADEWIRKEGKKDKRIITDVDLFDVSPCTYPAYDETEAAVRSYRAWQTRMGEEHRQEEEWRAIPYSRHGDSPKQDEDAPWDGPAQVADADVEELKKMSLFEDTENADIKGGYKGPHHTADGNRVNWSGVAAAMTVLRGGRGGFEDISDEEGSKAYNHLVAHYEQFDKEPPENPFRTEGAGTDKREVRARQAQLRVGELE